MIFEFPRVHLTGRATVVLRGIVQRAMTTAFAAEFRYRLTWRAHFHADDSGGVYIEEVCDYIFALVLVIRCEIEAPFFDLVVDEHALYGIFAARLCLQDNLGYVLLKLLVAAVGVFQTFDAILGVKSETKVAIVCHAPNQLIR